MSISCVWVLGVLLMSFTMTSQSLLCIQCNMHGSMVSIEHILGIFFLKLSIEETPSCSKKNWKVTSLPLLLNQVRRHPFSIKYAFLEYSPSLSRIVLAGTSSRCEYLPYSL